MELTPTQQQAYEAACQVIDQQRACKIRKLKHWQHGMCLCRTAIRPEVPDVNSEENEAIVNLWNTLPGYSSWMTALGMLCSQSPSEKENLS